MSLNEMKKVLEFVLKVLQMLVPLTLLLIGVLGLANIQIDLIKEYVKLDTIAYHDFALLALILSPISYFSIGWYSKSTDERPNVALQYRKNMHKHKITVGPTRT